MRILAAVLLLILPSGMTEEEFRKIQPEMRLKSKGWASLPWRATLTDARESAIREKKPIFMMVDTGNPIGFA